MKWSKPISAAQPCELFLENDALKASFLPHDGGRLTSLVAKPGGRDFIWTNARTTPLSRYHGANYDNLSAGGVEEAFPNVYADTIDGNELPFFGEVWPVCWSFQDSAKGEGWLMEADCGAYPVRVSKEWTLLPDGLLCAYTLDNLSGLTLPYLFGVHPSLRIEPGDELHLPDDDYRTGEMFPANQPCQESFKWPLLGGRDLRYPPQTACEYLQFFTEAAGGKIAVSSERDNSRLDILWDNAYFTALSVWMLYGGWRGHYCVMAEFFSGWPLVLSQAAAERKCTFLNPGEKQHTNVLYKLSAGIPHLK